MQLTRICGLFARPRGIKFKNHNNGIASGSKNSISVTHDISYPDIEESKIVKSIESKVHLARENTSGNYWMELSIAKGCLDDYLVLLSKSSNLFAQEILLGFEGRINDRYSPNEFLVNCYVNGLPFEFFERDVLAVLDTIYPYQ
jgi:hypothetical protein